MRGPLCASTCFDAHLLFGRLTVAENWVSEVYSEGWLNAIL